MAITIDEKQYDDTKLDEKTKNAVVQVQQGQARLRQLQGEFDNVKIIVAHYSKYLKDNLSEDALVKADDKPADKPAEQLKV